MKVQVHQTGGGGPERKDADIVSLALVATMLVLSIGLCLLICWGVLHALNRNQVARESARARAVEQIREFPPPQLLVHPGAEWGTVRAEEATKLNSYGWVDRHAWIIRIPVTRAMQLLVARGLPEVGAGQTRLQWMQSRAATDVQTNESGKEPTPEATP